MKRTVLTRKTPLRAKTSLKTHKPLKARKPMKRTPKKCMNKAERAHVANVMKLRCGACRLRPAGDPHHPKGHAFGTGTSKKASHYDVIPLCFACHDEYHDKGRTDWETKYGTQAEILEWVRHELRMMGMPDGSAAKKGTVLDHDGEGT